MRPGAAWRGSGPDQREDHLEALRRVEGMREPGGHEDHLARGHAVRLAGDADFRRAFQHLHERIERTIDQPPEA